MRTLSIVIVFCSAVYGQAQSTYACEPSPEVASAIREVDHLRASLAPDLCLSQARERMAVVLHEHPDDVFANLRYLSLFQQRGYDDVIAKYRTAMAQHPRDPRFELFYAASLIGTDTPEALRRLSTLTEVPGFPYPHLLIGQIRSYQTFQDHDAMSEHLIRFVEACPAYLPAYELLSFAGKGERLKDAAEALRHTLRGRRDEQALRAYRWLWPMEFRVAPPPEHDALRARIGRDLQFLRMWHRLEDPAAVETFRTGYRLSGNNLMLNLLPPPSPRKDQAVYDAERQWRKEHASAAGTDEYNRALVRAAGSWIEKWPDEPMPYLTRFHALALLPGTTEQELVAAGERLIAVNHKRPARFLTTPALVEVARVYVERGIRLNEIAGMLEVGRRETEAYRFAPESDLFDDRNQRLNEQFRGEARIQARAVEFEWALRAPDLAAAHRALDVMRQDIDRLAAVTTQPRVCQFQDAEYWKKMARLAELEGRAEDAAQYRRRADDRRNPSPSVAGSSMESLAGKRLPPFRATGLDGRSWNAADLEEKVTVMNVWATWCGPCLEELPHFQKLYDQLKSRLNVLVLSVNVDANPGVVVPFLKGRNYSFPVVLGHDYIDALLPELGIPRTWIVEAGTIISEQIGFASPAQWAEEIVAKVEGARRNGELPK